MIVALIASMFGLLSSTVVASMFFSFIRRISYKNIETSSEKVKKVFNFFVGWLDPNVLILIIIAYSSIYILSSISYFYFYYEDINIFKESDNFIFIFFLKFGLVFTDLKDDCIYIAVLSGCVFLINFVIVVCRRIISGSEFAIFRETLRFNSFILKWLFIVLLKAPITGFAFITPTFIIALNNTTGLWNSNLMSISHFNLFQVLVMNIFYFTVFSVLVCLVKKMPVYGPKEIISENKKEILLMTLQPVAEHFGFTLSMDHNLASDSDAQPDCSSEQDKRR